MRYLVPSSDEAPCAECGHLHVFVTRKCKPIAFEDLKTAQAYCSAFGPSGPLALLEDPTEVVSLIPDAPE